MKKVLCAIFCIGMVASLVGCTSSSTEYGEATLPDYTATEVDSDDVEVTDDDVQAYVDDFLDSLADEEDEGTVEDGDTVNIDYTGTMDGEEFDGGSDTDYDLEIGSDTFIDGFEDDIIGHDVGETFDIDLTFPDDYDEDYAGKDVTFEITINYIEDIPDYTDDLVAENAADYISSTFDDDDTTLETTDEFESYLYDQIYESNVESAAINAIIDDTEVTEYNQDDVDEVVDICDEYFKAYADYAGYDDLESFLIAMEVDGYDDDDFDADTYIESVADDIVKEELVLNTIADDFDINLTDDDYDEALLELANYYDYDSIDDFTDAYYEYNVLTYKINLLYNVVAEYIYDNDYYTVVDSSDDE